MKYDSLKELMSSTKGILEINKKRLIVKDENKLKKMLIDHLIYNGVFNEDLIIQKACRWIIWETARVLGIRPSSIQELYEAEGAGKCKGFTVPAVNIRGLTYDTARAVFRSAIKNKAGAFIFEIARSEMGYTHQRPEEYAVVIIAAAVKEGFRGPVFIQGDHFQFSARKFKENPKQEYKAIKDLTEEAIEAGFYNIDIDSSTLVELGKATVPEQQKNNYEVAAEITEFIREKQPKGITISVGAEIGEVGGKNSTPEELKGFMDGYIKTLKKKNAKLKGISKISIQTGTSHGGVVLPDGTIAKVNLDFDTLKNLSLLARKEYKLCGAVQHGASTLPADAFHRFPENETAEVHLATEFQNMIYENPKFPKALKDEIYEYLKKECASERKSGQTDEQFIYQMRKKGFGPFKQKFWDISPTIRQALSSALEDKFDFLFKKLNAVDTKKLTNKFMNLIEIHKPVPEGLNEFIQGKEVSAKKISGKRNAPEEDYHPGEIGE